MKKKIRILVDILLTVLLPVLMVKMLTGQELHEWFGMVMIVAFIAHHVLNFGWIKNLMKGKYTAVRTLYTVLDILMLADMLSLAYSGICMSGYVFTWLPIKGDMIFVRKLHLFASFWGLILMSLHAGIHAGMMLKLAVFKKKAARIVAAAAVIAASCFGVYSFVQLKISDYLFLKNIFLYFDSKVPGALYTLEFISVIVLFAALGFLFNRFLIKLASQRNAAKQNKDGAAAGKPENTSRPENTAKTAKSSGNVLKAVALILPVALIVLALLFVNGSLDFTKISGASTSGKTSTSTGNGSGSQQTASTAGSSTGASSAGSSSSAVNVNDGFVYITGGTFVMGSPEDEDWRGEDETQHEVTVGDFYISPYEVTQESYSELMGENPSMFSGKYLPVESISWLDAVKYCNALSEKEGLTPAYTITDTKVTWDESANGYRLPTEAEWEYACRAGTTTTFNTESIPGADECNFYGHYPYMIEANYYNQDVLETKPGVYRETTVEVGSFAPNAWGLYDCHGNVGEWVWDIYGEYDTTAVTNPTGPESGSMHINRGGGWNDFGKNLRSAYRATSMDGMASYSVGIRLVRGSVNGSQTKILNSYLSGSAAGNSGASESVLSGGRMLIVYFSWSGNTADIAEEIQAQTGADIFEIELETPYSTDYSTCLMEAQRDQNIQARPVIKNRIDNIDQYDIIFLGYPNWWASIPMPIASFLDDYDLSGKIIMPFCSNGGGKFGQSLSAIAKAEPDAIMKEGLSIYYGGGDTMKSDVAAWIAEGLK